MTKRDKWKQRECVLRYRAWADAARAAAGVHLTALQSGEPKNVFVRAYFPLPQSWSLVKQGRLAGKPHTNRPDADNVLKSVCDALFADDASVWMCTVQKRWADAGGARVEIEIQ